MARPLPFFCELARNGEQIEGPGNVAQVMAILSQWFPLGWKHYLAGGVTIGLGVTLLFALTGFIGGVSTTFSAVWSFFTRFPFFRQERFVASRSWRLAYALGLILGAAGFVATLGHGHIEITAVPWWQLLVGGVLVGLGARTANGCTSGHGICGLASLQLPSLLAVLTFLATAILTAHAVHALGGF